MSLIENMDQLLIAKIKKFNNNSKVVYKFNIYNLKCLIIITFGVREKIL